VFVIAGDLNKDGNLDLVTVNSYGSTISVLLGKGNGTFKAPVSYADGGATQATLGDFRGDGIFDVAFSEHSNDMEMMLGNGDGTLRPPVKFPLSSSGVWVAPGDFNGDGALDLVDLTRLARWSNWWYF
jgi:hypothetical protein